MGSSDSDYQILRRGALSLAMLSHFLFSSSYNMLIPIACGLKNKQNAVMIVLAETLMGLDRAHTSSTSLLSRASLVLQI